MDQVLIPQEITVIIQNGKKIIGRKEGIRNFSCVFGIGNKKFTTASDAVSDGNPTWNEEATIPIKKDCKDDLILKILENTKKIGKIIVPLKEISSGDKHSVRKILFTATPNFPHCSGEISFKCWVSKLNSNTMPEKYGKNSSMFFKNSKFANNQSKHSIDWSSIKNTSESRSTISDIKNVLKSNEIDSNNKRNLTRQDLVIESKQNSLNSDISFKNEKSDVTLVLEPPHVTSIKPKKIKIDKKEQVSIHGINFGTSMEDIIDVEIGGKSIKSNVIYHSSTLLFATFEPNTLEISRGMEIIITNRTNGKGTCEATLAVKAKAPNIKENSTNSFIKINENVIGPIYDSVSANGLINEEITYEKKQKKNLNPFSYETRDSSVHELETLGKKLKKTLNPFANETHDSCIHEEGTFGKKQKKNLNPYANEAALLNEKISELNAKNSALIIENESLKKSLDDIKEKYYELLSHVMVECPEVLEIL